MKLIYAYGTSDDIRYHANRRGTKEVNLLKFMPRSSPPDSNYLDFVMENVRVTSHTCPEGESSISSRSGTAGLLV